MKGPVLFSVVDAHGAARIIELKGREEWALSHLIAAGEAGCTPIDTPGPRWAHYVWLLRGRGIDIQTVTEAHHGPFPGHHGRYVLRTTVHRLSEPTAATAGRSGADAT